MTEPTPAPDLTALEARVTAYTLSSRADRLEADAHQFYRLAKAQGYEQRWSGAGSRAHSVSVKCTDRQWEQLRAEARAQWERTYAIG